MGVSFPPQTQQGSIKQGKFIGCIDCAKQLYREGGICRHIYRGTTPVLCSSISLSLSLSLSALSLSPSPSLPACLALRSVS